ncbi:MAG: ORF6N domain-containing protein [Elusimicrobia bacterium]|nr:ORF6N domain-containing protein [Elusimicrobiota bacterium]
MLDRDLASLYGIPTRILNEAVKRHRNRFPDDFMFKLTPAETRDLRSQFVTARPEILRSQSAISKKLSGGQRYLSNVFTEQGVAMLSSILNSERAVAIHDVLAVLRRLTEGG